MIGPGLWVKVLGQDEEAVIAAVPPVPVSPIRGHLEILRRDKLSGPVEGVLFSAGSAKDSGAVGAGDGGDVTAAGGEPDQRPIASTAIAKELRAHAPFTAFGSVTGVMIMAVLIQAGASREVCAGLFWTLHPLHVLLSALVTTGMYRLHGSAGVVRTVVIGYAGSVGVATLSDSIIPFLGEILLELPHRGVHLGFIEKWWLVNPLAMLGIALAWIRPVTGIPHAGHVLLSTWASLFHLAMAMNGRFDAVTLVLVVGFLFLAVWAPCCMSDIVFPLLFAGSQPRAAGLKDARVSVVACSGDLPDERTVDESCNTSVARPGVPRL